MEREVKDTQPVGGTQEKPERQRVREEPPPSATGEHGLEREARGHPGQEGRTGDAGATAQS